MKNVFEGSDNKHEIGAALEDRSGLFNSSLEGNTRRAIDFQKGDKVDEEALKTLIRSAVALSTSSVAKP